VEGYHDLVAWEAVCILHLMIRCLVAEVAKEEARTVLVDMIPKLHRVQGMIRLDQVVLLREVAMEGFQEDQADLGDAHQILLEDLGTAILCK